MTLTLNILVALLIAIGVSVGLFLVGGRHQAMAAQALVSAESALASVADPAAREVVEARAANWERTITPACRMLVKRTGATEKSIARAMALRLTLGWRVARLGFLLLMLGVLAGFLHRDRARDLVLYSSVTFSYLGKSLALASIAFGVFVALSPFAPPLWTLYPAMGTAALGAAVYVGNLPPRL